MTNPITNCGLPKEIFNLCFAYLNEEDLELACRVNNLFKTTASQTLEARHEVLILGWFHVSKADRLNPDTLLAAVGGIEKLKKIPHRPSSLNFDLIRKDPLLRKRSMVWISPTQLFEKAYPKAHKVWELGKVDCTLNIYLNQPTLNGKTIKRTHKNFAFPAVSSQGIVRPSGVIVPFYCKVITEIRSNQEKLEIPEGGDHLESSSNSSGYSRMLYESYQDNTLPELVQDITTSLDIASQLRGQEEQREKEKYQADKNLSCWGRFWKNISAFFYKIYYFFCSCIQRPSLEE